MTAVDCSATQAKCDDFCTLPVSADEYATAEEQACDLRQSIAVISYFPGTSRNMKNPHNPSVDKGPVETLFIKADVKNYE